MVSDMKALLKTELFGLVVTLFGWVIESRTVQLIGALMVIAVTGYIIYELDQLERRRKRKERHGRYFRDSDDRSGLH